MGYLLDWLPMQIGLFLESCLFLFLCWEKEKQHGPCHAGPTNVSIYTITTHSLSDSFFWRGLRIFSSNRQNDCESNPGNKEIFCRSGVPLRCYKNRRAVLEFFLPFFSSPGINRKVLFSFCLFRIFVDSFLPSKKSCLVWCGGCPSR